MQDFIVGPYDDTIKTANFPILSSIVGLAFGGESPFQAEIYYINLQGNNQVKFAIPYFDVADPRLPDFPVPVAVRGAITFLKVRFPFDIFGCARQYEQALLHSLARKFSPSQSE